MADQWYYTRQGQRFGPLSTEQMRQMALAGQLQQTDLIWTEGMTEWTPAGRVPQLFTAAPAAGQAPLSSPQASPAQAGSQQRAIALLAVFVDFGFRSFVTPSLVCGVWFLSVVVAALAVLGGAVALPFLKGPILVKLLVFFFMLFWLYIWLLGVRLVLEAILILFRIEDHARALKETAARLHPK